MGCYANEMSEYKEEEQHTNALTTMARDDPKTKTTGEGCQEDKEEAGDHNTTLPTLHCQ